MNREKPDGVSFHEADVIAEGRVRAEVAVVIPCYESSRFVGEAIESVLAQTYSPVHVVIVDDGSTDRLDDAVKPYRRWIHFIEQENQGVAAARNAGIEATTAPFIAFLDPDDRWRPEKIARQVAYLDAHTEASLVFCDRTWIDGSGNPIPPPPHRRPGALTLRGLLDGNFITPSGVLLRRSSLGADRFAPGIQGCEDWDLWLRLAVRCQFGYVRESLFEYRLHGSNVSSRAEAMLRGAATVLARAIARGLPPDLMPVAEAHRRRLTEGLAHYACERNDWSEARRLFEESGYAWSGTSRGRYVLTLLPPPVRNMLRGLKRRVAAAE